MPSGASIASTHTCQLIMPGVPPGTRQGHILPELVHSLVSIGKFCDDDCTAVFSRDHCKIYRKNECILTGPRDPTSRLWLLPLAATNHTAATACGPTTVLPAKAYSMNAYTTSNSTELMQFLHAAAFSPVTSTFLTAISAQHFHSWPGLSTARVRRFLPKSIPTAMGHLDRQRQNTRSTRPRPITPADNTADLNPTQEPNKTHAIFAAFHTGDEHKGVIYTDLTGAFPVTSRKGNKYQLVLYDYDSNSILVKPVKTRSDNETLQAYDNLYKHLTDRGFKPQLNILDNEASTALKRAILKRDATIHLVEPNNHRVNAAKRAIRTYKNHFIAGLCSTDPNFPIYLWDELIPQAVLTLNLLRTSRMNPALSAHAQLHGLFDFNRTPLAPPGTRAVIFEDPDTRESWGPHGKLAWYLGPASEHYRCYRFFIPETNGVRISGTAEFFPHQ
jgi:hypothetical protein